VRVQQSAFSLEGTLFLPCQMPSVDIPTVENIYIYPIKSCHYTQLQECEVDNLGIANDRRFMIIYDDSNHFVTQR
jgi:hypothetical protein